MISHPPVVTFILTCLRLNGCINEVVVSIFTGQGGKTLPIEGKKWIDHILHIIILPSGGFPVLYSSDAKNLFHKNLILIIIYHEKK